MSKLNVAAILTILTISYTKSESNSSAKQQVPLKSILGDNIFLKQCERFIDEDNNNGKTTIISDGDYNFKLKSSSEVTNEDHAQVQILKCNEQNTVSFTMKVSDVTQEARKKIYTVYDTNLTMFGDIRDGDDYYAVQDYCVQKISDSEIQFKACKPNCKDGSTTCIPKCCSIGKSMGFAPDEDGYTAMECMNSGEQSWFPTIYSSPYKKSFANNTFHYIHMHLNCSDTESNPAWVMKDFQVLEFDKIKFKLLEDGTIIYLPESRIWTKLPSGTSYCIDGIIYKDNSNYSGNELDQILIQCSVSTLNFPIEMSLFYVAVMLCASVFLLLTAIVYILLWDRLLKTVHGWTVFSLVVSMFLMYVFMVTAHLVGNLHDIEEEAGSKFCVAVGILAHFFFLSAFCWMTLINVDLFWTFRSMSPQGSGKSKGIKRFIAYIIFALAVPLTVVITGLVLTHEFPDTESEVIVPDYGKLSCYISPTAAGPYLYSIIGSLIFTNIILIVITLTKVYYLQENAKFVSRNGNTNTYSLKLFVKLFLIMGATWISEIIGWLIDRYEIRWYRTVGDLINFSQAGAIFIIFVCKRKIWIQLQNKYVFFKQMKSIFPRRLKNYNVSNKNNSAVIQNQSNNENHDVNEGSSFELEGRRNSSSKSSCNNSQSSKMTDLSRTSSIKTLEPSVVLHSQD